MQMQAAPYATSGGKASFSAADAGGIGAAFADRLGLDPNASLLNYTGTMDIDPESLLSQFDTRLGGAGPLDPGRLRSQFDADLGVGGELVRPPSLLSGEGTLPTAPNLPAAPSLIAPQRAASLLAMPAGPLPESNALGTPAAKFVKQLMDLARTSKAGAMPFAGLAGANDVFNNDPPGKPKWEPAVNLGLPGATRTPTPGGTPTPYPSASRLPIPARR
mgnify:FL=1